MYIYFPKLNSVLTCETYPQIITVDVMNNPEYNFVCNKWEKKDTTDGNFILFYKYTKPVCKCDPSKLSYLKEHVPDYDDYDCYNCGHFKVGEYEEGTELYLENSGSQDIVWAQPFNKYYRGNVYAYELCEVDGYPNVYKWANGDTDILFILHMEKNGRLSDINMFDKFKDNIDNCEIVFKDNL